MKIRKPIHSSLLNSILKGSGAAFILSVLGSFLIAKFIEGETLAEDLMKYAVMVLTMLSATVGAVLGMRNVESKKVVICLGTAAGYMLLLTASNIMLFDGKMAGVLPSALVCVGSAMAVFLLNLNRKKNNKQKWKGKYR